MRNAKSTRGKQFTKLAIVTTNKKYKKAIESFSRVANTDDSLTQISYYHMADSYLNLDEKDYARNAFQEASKLNFDLDIRRNSLFNYAKLAYELSYNPYDEAINAFQQFIEDFPDSEDAKDAYRVFIESVSNN